MPDNRLLELSRRLAEKQKEIDTLQHHAAGIRATRGWKVVTVLSLVRRLLALQPEAYHHVAAVLRRRAGLLLQRWRRRGWPSAGPVAPPDNHALYTRWRETNEADAAQLATQRRLSRTWRSKVLVSIVTPVFRPPAPALADTIASVMAQTYEHWEFVLVLAGPQPDDVIDVTTTAAADSRIRVVTLEENLGIAANTNAGIAGSAGTLVAFLDHDDLLAPDMLYEVVRLFRMEPDLDLVTFDEDKVAADGVTRIDPIFKPSCTSPEHLLSFNDRMHSVVSRRAIDQIGGLASGVDGAQDWDLGLRLLEIGARSRHLPRVLYHWRMVPGSAAGDALAKPWAFEAQRVALQGHLVRQGLTGVVVSHPQIGVVRVAWQAPSVRASIIIPTKDKATLLGTCLDSIRAKTTHPDYEILVIDTGSREPATEQLYQRLAGDRTIRILRDDQPFNFSRVNNIGAREATGDILVFLNNDIEVIDGDWLEELVRWASRADVGCVGPKLVYPDGSLQHAGIVAGMCGHGSHVYQGGPAQHTWGVFGSVDFYRNYLMLGGACLAVRRSVFDEVGGFDEAYELCYSDLDLCLKAAEQGYRSVYTPFATLVHHEGGTRGRRFPPADVLRASVRMYPLVLQGDPFYNHNLSFQEHLPTIAPDDSPSSRAELITHIAGLFGITAELRAALHDELLGRTSAWRGYERLVRASLSPAPGADRRPGALRVLFVSHDLSRSGAPMVVLHLVRALTKLGHSVSVLSPKDGRLRHDLEDAGATVIVSPLALAAPYALREVFQRFDAILPNTVLAWRVVLAAHALQKPVVWLIHESFYGLLFVRGEAGAIQALVVADEVVFPSKQTLSMYAEFSAGNMSAERYGIDEPMAPESALLGGRRDRIQFMAIGSLEPRKGQDVLITAFRKLPRSVRDRAELHVYGRSLDPVFEAGLRGVAGALPVTFHGEIAPAEMLERLAVADVLVCPSRDETGPLVVMEAMGLGKAIISTTVGAVPELIDDGVSGLLVEPGKVPPLRAALHRLATEPDLVRRLGASAQTAFHERVSNERYGMAVMARIRRAMAREASALRADGIMDTV